VKLSVNAGGGAALPGLIGAAIAFQLTCQRHFVDGLQQPRTEVMKQLNRAIRNLMHLRVSVAL
jgi:hypothetical protein